MATPRHGVLNATANTPAASPLGSGVSEAFHERPPSRDSSTRAFAPPPVAIHAWLPLVVTHCPDAANANSPGNASGMPLVSLTCHDRPPSHVLRTRNLPLTGSLNASPRNRSK